MADPAILASQPAPEPAVRAALIRKPPVSLGASLSAVVPGFAEDRLYEITRWNPRGASLPAAGDEALVAFAEDGEPWLVAWWPAAGQAADVPAGVVLPFAGGAAPPGFLLADGLAHDRTIYAALFAVIGTTYGSGDGSTTFNVPDVKGKVLAGRDPGQAEFDTLGETGGAKTHTLAPAEMPSHTHDFSGERNTNYSVGGATGGMFNLSSGTAGDTDRTTTSAGSGAAHNNLQPYLVVNGIIKT